MPSKHGSPSDAQVINQCYPEGPWGCSDVCMGDGAEKPTLDSVSKYWWKGGNTLGHSLFPQNVVGNKGERSGLEMGKAKPRKLFSYEGQGHTLELEIPQQSV